MTAPHARCLVRVSIGVDGRPREPEVKGCAEPFAEAASSTVARWRWEPVLNGGVPEVAVTAVSVVFQREGEPTPPQPGSCEWRVTLGSDGALTEIREPPPPCAGWMPRRLADPGLLRGATGPARCRCPT